MPPSSVPERTVASGQYAATAMPPAPPKRMMSPLGYVATGLGMLFAVFVVFLAAASFQSGRGPTPAGDGYEEVDLGQVTRELATDTGGLVREPFMVKVVVVLNPKGRDLAALKSQVERRRNLFRDIVWSEIINPKSDADLRKPAMLETLKGEIRQRLNQELGGAKDGQDPISRVIFPERRLPERR